MKILISLETTETVQVEDENIESLSIMDITETHLYKPHNICYYEAKSLDLSIKNPKEVMYTDTSFNVTSIYDRLNAYKDITGLQVVLDDGSYYTYTFPYNESEGNNINQKQTYEDDTLNIKIRDNIMWKSDGRLVE